MPTPHKVGTPEFKEEVSLQNFVSDLYMRKMYGYKPPKTSRITIQPEFHNIWNRTWRFGSIVSIAPYYNYDEYAALDTMGKYKYILDILQWSVLQLSDEYKWDRAVFERAYTEVLECNFVFRVVYPSKMSRDKKKSAKIYIEKTETTTSVYTEIVVDASPLKIKLFEKNNAYWYGAAYVLAKYSKWFDNDRFGISHAKNKTEIWYSIKDNQVSIVKNGNKISEAELRKSFLLG